MYSELIDLEEEWRSLDRLLSTLPPAEWDRRTDFFDWTVRDQIMHLHLVDLFGMEAVGDSEAFLVTVERVRKQLVEGIELSAEMRARFGRLDNLQLLQNWRSGCAKLCGLLRLDSPERRVPWFGPTMKVRSLASARQMETWAHGQDIYDCLGIERSNTDRIRNVCELGVKTFSWSFKNRAEAPPAVPPRVRLRAPSGASWAWNLESSEQVSGTAEDFALVVTQRRNVADTLLEVTGPGAERWLQIAQCFAGRPENPPPPGVRARHAPVSNTR